MTHRTDRVIENLIGHLTALSNELPHARRALLDQLRAVDGLKGSDYTAGGRSSPTVEEVCAGERRCTDLECPDTLTRHTHPCRDNHKGKHTHKVTIQLTGPEALAGKCEGIQRKLDDLDGNLNAMVLIVRNLRADCQREMQAPTVKPRCDGGVGRDGALDWAFPECTNIPDQSRTLCSRCRQAEYRWRKDHNKPPREDAA